MSCIVPHISKKKLRGLPRKRPSNVDSRTDAATQSVNSCILQRLDVLKLMTDLLRRRTSKDRIQVVRGKIVQRKHHFHQQSYNRNLSSPISCQSQRIKCAGLEEVAKILIANFLIHRKEIRIPCQYQ